MELTKISENWNYFSIHNIKALESKQFSIVRGNIECSPDKLKIAHHLYTPDLFYIEFHNSKKNMNWVIGK